MNKQLLTQIVLFAAIIGAMYFFLIRPQKKKEKEVNDMRNSLNVGDEIITIGGIKGKIVKTKDDSIVIQVGADKVKFEMMRWSVSSVVKKAESKSKFDEEEAPKQMPKRLKKVEKQVEEVEEKVEKLEEEVASKEAEA